MYVRFVQGVYQGRSFDIGPPHVVRLLELGEVVRVASLEPGAPELDANNDAVHLGPPRPPPAPVEQPEQLRLARKRGR